ncbi:MAG: hypothetical protein LBI28_08550 [Treponema sp.]|jgi:tetratricopeptide (TPR) repeat protein|nr:hypothetical protein [Treponema sp.]
MVRIVSFVLIILSLNTCSQNANKNAANSSSEILLECEKLIEDHKYSSAYEMLCESKEDEYILAKKIQILLENSKENYRFHYFIIVDSYFSIDENKKMIVFDIIKEINRYQRKNGISGILQLYAGHYYHKLYIYSREYKEAIMDEDDINEKMFDSYSIAISMGYSDHDLCRNYADLNFRMGNYDMSIEYYKQAIAFDKSSDIDYQRLAEVYYKNNEYEKSIETVNDYLSQNHVYSYLLFYYYRILVYNYIKLKDYDKLYEYINKAEQIERASYGLFSLKNFAFLSIGEFEKSKEEAKKYVYYIYEHISAYYESEKEHNKERYLNEQIDTLAYFFENYKSYNDQLNELINELLLEYSNNELMLEVIKKSNGI